MSAEQNIQIIRKAYGDFSRGNINAVLDAFAENVEWVTPGGNELSGVRHGRVEVAGFFKAVGEMWEFLAFEPKEYIPAGDKVVVLGRYQVRSRQTGRTTGTDWAMVWTFRNGKAIHFQEYTDTATLEAATMAAAAS